MATPATPATPEDTRAPHRRLLEPWAAFAERLWYDLPDRTGLGCFGTGFGAWGVQTNQKYLAAAACLALDLSLIHI